jgi:hypothetical protein
MPVAFANDPKAVGALTPTASAISARLSPFLRISKI